MTPEQREERDRYYCHAAWYGLYLRQQGYSTDEIAALVIVAYPDARRKIEHLLRPPQKGQETLAS